jgi:hypothetical protein
VVTLDKKVKMMSDKQTMEKKISGKEESKEAGIRIGVYVCR